MKILLCGQKWFGAEVFRALRGLNGVEITAVSAPLGGEKTDRLAGQALLHGLPLIPAGTLNAGNLPGEIDLLIAAHSHDFLGQKTRLRARYGGIGYHPSLLPLHRGRDAIRWAIHMGEKVTGGTVYRLSNRMDGGEILAQRHVFIKPGEDAKGLWQRALGPLGVELLTEICARYAREGYLPGTPQDESLATWEPAIDRPPAFRPDLDLLPYLPTQNP